MEVVDALTALITDVGYEAIAARLQSQLSCHPCGSEKKSTEQLSIFCISMRNRYEGLSRNHQHMYWCLGIDVPKCNDMVIFVESLGRTLAGDDLCKDGHVRS